MWLLLVVAVCAQTYAAEDRITAAVYSEHDNEGAGDYNVQDTNLYKTADYGAHSRTYSGEAGPTLQHNKCHMKHCNGLHTIGMIFVVLFLLVALLVLLLVFNRIFSMRDEISFLTKQIWSLLDALLHLEKIYTACAFLVLVLCFVYFLMSHGFGYIQCNECGREMWYLRYAGFCVCFPVLLMIACDFTLLGFQIEIGEGKDFGALLQFILKDSKVVEAITTGLGVLKALIQGTFGTNAAQGFRVSLMGAAFVMPLCLTLATVTCGSAKWAFFAFSVVFFFPISHALFFTIPNGAARIDPTLIPLVKTQLEKDMPELVGVFYKLVKVMCFILWVCFFLQFFLWVMTFGVPFFCLNTATAWSWFLDTIMFLLPMGLAVIGWMFFLPALIQGLVTPAIDQGLDKLESITPSALSAGPEGVNDHGGINQEDDQEQDVPMQLDEELAMRPPNKQYNYWMHLARCILFGSKNTKVMWQLVTHEHISKSFFDHSSSGSKDVAQHFRAAINMLDFHGELD